MYSNKFAPNFTDMLVLRILAILNSVDSLFIHLLAVYVSVKNAYQLLPLAHEYQIQDIVRRCENYIITDKPKISNVKLADVYGLQRLRNHCMNKIGTYFPLADITGDDDYKTLCEASRFELLCKRISTMEARIPGCDGSFSDASNDCRRVHCDAHDHWSRVENCLACNILKKRAFYKSLFP